MSLDIIHVTVGLAPRCYNAVKPIYSHGKELFCKKVKNVISILNLISVCKTFFNKRYSLAVRYRGNAVIVFSLKLE